MRHASLAIAAGAVLAAATPASAASTEVHVTHAYVDAWDPVVLLDIGTRNVSVMRGDTYDPAFLQIDESSRGASLTAYAEAQVGALHVSAQTAFDSSGQAGDWRSANFNAYAGWQDTLEAQFIPDDQLNGYAYIDLLVSGSTTTIASPQGAGGLAFARTYAGISVTGTNSYDSIRTTIVSLDNRNYVTRRYTYPGDPNIVPGNFDPNGGFFLETPPITTSIKKQFEGGSDYFPDPSQAIAGTDFTDLNGTFRVRVPFTVGETTFLDVRLKCESYAGAEPGEAAVGDCDLGRSVYWGGIDRVTDRDGNLISGVTFSSESGFDYSRSFAENDAIAVPEPASWALLIVGFGLVGGTARRRRVAVAA